MAFESYEKNGILIVKIREERLDANTAVAFKEYLTGFITEGKTRIILNLAEVDFIDSSGLGSIVTILKRLSGKGDLCICSPTAPVENMFKLTRMERVFKIFDAEETAFKTMSS